MDSGADAIVLVDLKQDDADRAAQELEDWFGAFSDHG